MFNHHFFHSGHNTVTVLALHDYYSGTSDKGPSEIGPSLLYVAMTTTVEPLIRDPLR